MAAKKSIKTTQGRQTKRVLKGKTFTSEYQPSGAAKSAGMWKKKRGAELVQAVMELAFKGMKNGALKRAAADYFMIDESEITVEMMLHFRQAKKAIDKSDTFAYDVLMKRAYGNPKETINATLTTDVIRIKKKKTTDEWFTR